MVKIDNSTAMAIILYNYLLKRNDISVYSRSRKDMVKYNNLETFRFHISLHRHHSNYIDKSHFANMILKCAFDSQ